MDYVIVDEVHHAEAPTYRRVLKRLQPCFLLGLTATPDSADEGDILGLFDGFVPYGADLEAGITGGRLVPSTIPAPHTGLAQPTPQRPALIIVGARQATRTQR